MGRGALHPVTLSIFGACERVVGAMSACAQLRAFAPHATLGVMESHHQPPHVKLAEWWSATSSGITVNKNDPVSVAALEERYGIALPTDFRTYLICGCPQNDPSWDNELTNWWPIDRIKNIPDEYNHDLTSSIIKDVADKSLFFADFSIWCWAWAICCDEGEHRGKVAVIGAGDRFVATSFNEFVERYIADPAGFALCPEYPANGS